jgi:hypothetical protein
MQAFRFCWALRQSKKHNTAGSDAEWRRHYWNLAEWIKQPYKCHALVMYTLINHGGTMRKNGLHR